MPASILVLVLSSASPQWRAPPGCPEAAALAERVRALTGRVPKADELRADASVEGPPWRASIELGRGSANERRTVDAESCEGLLAAYAVMIAVAMDPVEVVARATAAGRIVPTPRDGASHAAAPPAADVPSVSRSGRDTPVEPTPTRRVPQSFALRAGAGVTVGGWDRAAGAVEVAMAWSRAALEIDLVGRYYVRRRDMLDDAGAIDVELGTVGVLACWLGNRRRLTLTGCVGIEAGDFVIDGVSAPATRRVHFPWVAPLFGGRLAFRPRAPLALFLGLEAAIPITRLQASLRADEPVEVYEAGSPAVRALAGIELRWVLPPRRRTW